MDWLSSRIFKVISFVVLFFFTWTSGGLFQVAYAVKDIGKGQEVSGQQKQKEEKTEEKLQKTLDEIEGILTDPAADTITKKNKLKPKKSEIGSIDAEIKKQFKETEGRIKDLPDEIKQRHKDFVKHYDDNLKELNTNLDAIDKAKTEIEITSQIEKTKAFLEKAKPPKKHTPLDPDNLPWIGVISLEGFSSFLGKKMAKITTKNGTFLFPYTMKEQSKDYPKLALTLDDYKWIDESGNEKKLSWKIALYILIFKTT